jgi:hypothetical protein
MFHISTIFQDKLAVYRNFLHGPGGLDYKKVLTLFTRSSSMLRMRSCGAALSYQSGTDGARILRFFL